MVAWRLSRRKRNSPNRLINATENASRRGGDSVVYLLCLQIGKLLFLMAFCANTVTVLIPSIKMIPSVRGEPA